MLFNFLKIKRIKAEIYKEPGKAQGLKGIETGAKQGALYLEGKIHFSEKRFQTITGRTCNQPKYRHSVGIKLL